MSESGAPLPTLSAARSWLVTHLREAWESSSETASFFGLAHVLQGNVRHRLISGCLKQYCGPLVDCDPLMVFTRIDQDRAEENQGHSLAFSITCLLAYHCGLAYEGYSFPVSLVSRESFHHSGYCFYCLLDVTYAVEYGDSLPAGLGRFIGHSSL